MQTEFYSPKGLRQYGVRFANGILRRKTGSSPTSTTITGPLGLAKIGLSLVSKKLGLHKPTEREIISRFTIDPKKNGAFKLLGSPMQEALEK